MARLTAESVVAAFCIDCFLKNVRAKLMDTFQIVAHVFELVSLGIALLLVLVGYEDDFTAGIPKRLMGFFLAIPYIAGAATCFFYPLVGFWYLLCLLLATLCAVSANPS